MLSATGLVRRPEFAISAVTCRNDHTGWSRAEVLDRSAVVLVRRGRFRRRVRGTVTEVDSTVGMPAHPARRRSSATRAVATSAPR